MNKRVVRVPLCGRTGEVAAYAVVDLIDAHFANHRWCRNAYGYAIRRAPRTVAGQSGKILFLHREILQAGPDEEVDHKDRDTLNNRRSNLRLCSHALNHQNRASHRGSTSVYRGVYWDSSRQRWVAEVRLGGRKYFLGRFDEEEAAAMVVAKWREEHMPFTVEA